MTIQNASVQIPLWIDLAAVGVGAVQGASFAAVEDERVEYDVLAGFVFAIVVGLGGGILRDVLLNIVPAALANGWYLITAVIAAVAGMVLAYVVHRQQLLVNVLDAAALGLFVVVGVVKAHDADLGVSAGILLGTITGVGGGMLRDLLAARPVEVIQRTAPYAVIALAGAATFELLTAVGVSVPASASVTFVVILVARIVSLFTDWRTPPPPVWRQRAR
ncbi:TRIC cation channel family protein [Aldersonia sp. NBC_00410]|uniref:trimeric intracellular cation channel family protein n=1 Tax=Aldersonia sp. NBC_00410 TaxID=2975954 RepID=UPI0022584BDF|nr:TRIC cation channel family protein [Aldersonia sp. NBC_00410]MCX5044940.1 TRIC cation channel family protein [Aldersonia sp. NBC_00410]